MNGQGAGFKDHFSGHAGDYAAHRPSYPPELFHWLAGQAPGRSLAWDCATGNGQAAIPLAEHFDKVVASDASREQVARAVPHPKISYRVEPVEQSHCNSGSIDLVTAAQAYHWFDHAAFHREAGRVVKPDGILAVWAYPLAVIDVDVDAVVYELYQNWLGSYWPAERQHLENGCMDLPLPWPEIAAPRFEMSARWTLPALIGYLETWSAMRRYMAVEGRNPLETLRPELAKAWGDTECVKTVRWPLILRVCRKIS